MLTATKSKRPFATDEARWQAVQRRDPAADGAFYSAVKTTGIYCRPVCPARTPLRKNIAFYDTTAAAERAGFRPCKRCRPQEPSLPERHADLVARTCRLIEEADESPSLQTLAESVSTSPYHLHRLFKAQTGLTPKQYAAARRAERVRGELTEGSTVTQAIYGAGYGSNSRFYESSTEMLGMTPTAYRAGGRGTTIRFAVSRCWLGHLLVASTDKGICSIMLDDDPAFLRSQLEKRFPRAELLDGKQDFKALICAGGRVRVGPVARPQPPARHSRHGLPAASLAGPPQNPRRHDDHLHEHREADRSSRIGPRLPTPSAPIQSRLPFRATVRFTKTAQFRAIAGAWIGSRS